MPNVHPSAGTGEAAAFARETLFETLPPMDQETFLAALEEALEAGEGEDAAWERAWTAVQLDLPDESEGADAFALEDEEP